MGQVMFRRNRLIEFGRYLLEMQNNGIMMATDRPTDEYLKGIHAGSTMTLNHFLQQFNISEDELREGK